MPLHVGIGFEDLAEPAGGDRSLQKLDRFIEAMLAHHAEQNSSFARSLDHCARGLEIRGHRLLHLYVFFLPCAQFDRLETNIREGADIYEIDFRVVADILPAL